MKRPTKNNLSNKFSRNSGENNRSYSSRSNNFSKSKNSKFDRNSSKNKDPNEKQNSKIVNPRSNYFKTKETNASKNKRNDLFKEKNLEDMVWGKHSVYEVLLGDKPINRIWCTSEIRSSEKFLIMLKEIKSKGVLVEEVPWSRISQLTCGGVHQGIVLQVAYSQSISLKDLINLSKEKSNISRIICLDGITDPHNVGAIVRSAEAFGCTGIVIPQRRSAGITGSVAKAAAGALENIAICRVVNLNRGLDELKKAGFIVAGLSIEGKINLSSFDGNMPLVLVIGSESKGLSLLTQKHCDYLLKIPLKGKTSSLNASVAAAISMFELSKSLNKN